ncbi:MAG: glycosyltransferase family 4 protein [bacterium]
MTRILILGIGPLARSGKKKFHSGGNRAWHLTKPLLDAGHEVTLICMRTTGSTSDTEPLESRYQEDNLTYYEVDEVRCFANDEYLHQKIREHQSEVLIGACDYPAARAAAVAGDLPLWADIHGYPMGEAQAKAYHYQEPGYIHHFWNFHREVLRRADRFSVTSERQRMTTIGELGVMGRMNQYTFLEPLVTHIPIAWNPETPYVPHTRRKNDPFIILFSGGYNLWCDVETLFQGLEKAMRSDNRIRFLSTGGVIDGHDEKTYPRFQRMVEQSDLRDRFDLRGWVSPEELTEIQRMAHLGINVDLPCYETLIGARNRLTEFMARGIPILTTLCSEISQILHYKSLVLSVPTQNPDILANEIILAANHPERMEKIAVQARALFEEQYTFHNTTKELMEWCNNPVHSGDFGKPILRLDYRWQDERLPSVNEPQGFTTRLKNYVKRKIQV